MTDRLWKSEAGLSNIYISLDKNKLAKVALAKATLDLASEFGYLSKIEIPSNVKGKDSFLEYFNETEWDQSSSHICKEVYQFIEINPIDKMYFHLGTYIHDLDGPHRLSDLVSFSFYLDSTEEDWGLYFNINNDIFAPYGWESNPQAEKLAKQNASLLKAFLKKVLTTFPINSYEWEEDYSNIQGYLFKK